MERTEYTDSLRKIADWFDTHQEIPIPHDAHIFYLFSVHTREGMEQVARVFGACEKEYADGLFKLKKQFGAIEMQVVAGREQICNRKVTGSKVVPETVIPAHSVDIVEWECLNTPLLAASDPLSALPAPPLVSEAGENGI